MLLLEAQASALLCANELKCASYFDLDADVIMNMNNKTDKPSNNPVVVVEESILLLLSNIFSIVFC